MVSVKELKEDVNRLHERLREKMDEYEKLTPEEKYKQAEILARCHELIDAIGKLQAIRPNPGEVRAGDVGTLTKFRVWFTTPIGFERFVDVEAIDEGEAKRLAEKQVPAGSEFRGAFRKQGAASQISEQAEVYPEVREGDVGTLTESLMADDTSGYSHRIPAGMEIKVARVEPKFIGFHTGDVIEGENYFITPLTLEFRRKFRKNPSSVRRGAPREALPWYNPERWEITYEIDDERRTFKGIGELNKLIAKIQDYALYAGKKFELTGAARIK